MFKSMYMLDMRIFLNFDLTKESMTENRFKKYYIFSEININIALIFECVYYYLSYIQKLLKSFLRKLLFDFIQGRFT